MPPNQHNPKKYPWKKTAGIAAVLALAVLAAPIVVHAFAGQGLITDAANLTIGNLLKLGLRAVSALFALVVAAFVAIVQWDFRTAADEAVGVCWILIRDISNLFFVVVMLVIAFATMLKIEAYRWQKLMPKLILTAILINFSKTITLMIMDVGQVAMISFVRSFQHVAIDNLTSGLMIDKIFQIGYGNDISDLLTAWAAQIFMGIMMLISSVVMLVIVIILIVRIGTLWMLVALSPAPYILSILDATKKHATKWWDTFIQMVILGPILAFFIWFVFLFMSYGLMSQKSMNSVESAVNASGFTSEQYLPSEAITPANILRFLLAIILLIVGTFMAISSSGAGGKVAGHVWQAAGRKVGTYLSTREGQPGLFGRVGSRLEQLSTRIGTDKKTGEARTGFLGGLAKTMKGAGKGSQRIHSVTGRAWQRVAPMLTPYYWKGWKKERDWAYASDTSRASTRGEADAARAGTLGDIKTTAQRLANRRRYQRELDRNKDRKAKIDLELELNLNNFAAQSVQWQKDERGQQWDAIRANEDERWSGFQGETVNLKNMPDAVRTELVTMLKAEGMTEIAGLVDNGKDPGARGFAPDELAQFQTAVGKYKDKKLEKIDERKTEDLKQIGDVDSMPEDEKKRIGQAYAEAKKKTVDEDLARFAPGQEQLVLHQEFDLRNKNLEKLMQEQVELMQQFVAHPDDAAIVERLEKMQKVFRDLKADDLLIDRNDFERGDKGRRQQLIIQKQDELEKAKLASTKFLDFKQQYSSEAEVEQMTKRIDEEIKVLDDKRKKAQAIGNVREEELIRKRIRVLEEESNKASNANGAAQDFETNFRKYYKFSEAEYKDPEKRKEVEKQRTDHQTKLKDTSAVLDKSIAHGPMTLVEWEKLGDEKKRLDEEDKKYSEKMVAFRDQGAFYERAGEQKAIMEQYQMIDHIQDSGELYSIFKSAMGQHDRYLALAAVRKMNDTYNLNDLVNNSGYDANINGLNKFTNEILIKQLGMGEQQALGFQNDMSYMAEERNHWTFARSIKSENGRLAQNNEYEQAGMVAAELYKKGGRDLAGRLNRLGYGGETADGGYRLSLYAYPVISAFARDFAYVMRRGEMNKNAMMRFIQPEVKRQLMRYGKIWGAKHPEYPRVNLDFGNILEMMAPPESAQDAVKHFYKDLSGRGMIV